MESSFPPFDAQLAQLTHTTRRSIRDLLEREGFVEITHPNLDPGKDVAFYDAFRVTIPGNEKFAAFTGTLLVSGSRYLIEASNHVGRAYRIGPSFRVADERKNRLFEFQSIHLSHEGTIHDAQALVEQILQKAIEDARPVSMAHKNELRKLSFPLRRITHAEATKSLGLKSGSDLTLDHQFQLLSKMNAAAIFLTNTPQSVNPYAVFHRLVDGVEQNYELIAQHGGELFVGGEYETRMEHLTKQLAGSPLLKRAVELGASPENYAKPLLELLSASGSRLRRGPVCIYGAFERLIQFLRPVDTIERASLYPVTGKFLVQTYD